jgi:MFS transporter, PAT family, beta-lactamase induction signal transducer AmpG
MAQPSQRSVYLSPRVWLMFALGFSSGLPLYLTRTTLTAWLTTMGLNLKTIGFFSLVGTAYTLKFLWAPLMDRYVPPFLGRRRGWMLITQVMLAVGLLVMAQINPLASPGLMAAVAVAVAFFAASQDISIDAFRTDSLTEEERSFGIATFNVGYRVGMVVAMSLALIIAAKASWRTSYTVMALFMLVGVAATFLAREPLVLRPPRNLVQAVVLPFREFVSRGWPALVAIAFILVFRVGDAVAAAMNTPYVLRLGFTLIQVGTIQKGVGMAGAIAGAVVGGLLVSRIGVRRSLLLFGSAQAATNLLYIALGSRGLDPLFLALTVGADNFAGGLGSAAITVFITALCNKNFSATQYALMSSLSAVPLQLMGGFSGVLVEAMGWPAFFTATALAMAPALLLLLLLPANLGAPKPDPELTPEVVESDDPGAPVASRAAGASRR